MAAQRLWLTVPLMFAVACARDDRATDGADGIATLGPTTDDGVEASADDADDGDDSPDPSSMHPTTKA